VTPVAERLKKLRLRRRKLGLCRECGAKVSSPWSKVFCCECLVYRARVNLKAYHAKKGDK
jgi:hypothetical protein